MAINPFHDQKTNVVKNIYIGYFNDAAMIQFACLFCFLNEQILEQFPTCMRGNRQIGFEDLQRHVVIKNEMPGSIHYSHATNANQVKQVVRSEEHTSEL